LLNNKEALGHEGNQAQPHNERGNQGNIHVINSLSWV
jgi:hypothetical protein